MKGLSKAMIITTALLTSMTSFSAPQDRRGGDFGGRHGGNYGGGRHGGGFDYQNPRMQQQRIQLRFGGEQMRGQSTIFLKQEIKKQNPYMDLQNMELESVKLVAKTKAGRGQASLVVGQSQTYSEVIEGTPYDFHDNAPYTYDRVTFDNPSRSSQGKWQIKLQGNFKVKKVVVNLTKKNKFTKMKISFDEHFRGFNTLKLKRMARLQTGQDMSQFELEAVKLVAKSKHGQGKATLIVGYDESMTKTIEGNPRQFQSSRPASFDTVTLQAPEYGSAGKWQIDLQGNIKVKDVVLILKKKRSRF